MNKQLILCSLTYIATGAAGFGVGWYIRDKKAKEAEKEFRHREHIAVMHLGKATKRIQELEQERLHQDDSSEEGVGTAEPRAETRIVPGNDKPASVFDLKVEDDGPAQESTEPGAEGVLEEDRDESDSDTFLPGEVESNRMAEIREEARTTSERPDNIYSISPEPVVMGSDDAAQFDYYDQDHWTWYEGDEVMADGLDNPFGDWEHYIGREWLNAFGPEGVNPNDPNVVYIRRDIDGILIEVARTPEGYADSHEGVYGEDE